MATAGAPAWVIEYLPYCPGRGKRDSERLIWLAVVACLLKNRVFKPLGLKMGLLPRSMQVLEKMTEARKRSD